MSAASSLLDGSAAAIAAAVRAREVTVGSLVEASLARIVATDPALRALAHTAADRARQRAEALDVELLDRTAAAALLPLLGVPFVASNAIDVAGIETRVGTAFDPMRAPARRDAVAIARLEEAGAVLVGTTQLDAWGAGSTGDTSGGGPIRNPHDLARMAGGSSGGSAAAVACGQVPLALGTDAFGGVRVPASLCGLFALKPTYGRVPRTGVHAFAPSLEHVGLFGRKVADVAAAHDAMQGHDARDATSAARPPEPVLPGLWNRVETLRVAVLGDGYTDAASPEAQDAVRRVADALNARRVETLAGSARAEGAALLVALSEGAALHREALASRADAYATALRHRLHAGALMPAAWLQHAQRLRRWYALRAAELLREFDVLIAPATPCAAPALGTASWTVDARERPIDDALAALARPLSFIGLPVAVVPVWDCHPSLPVGVQLVGAPWREDVVLRVAQHLQGSGIARAPRARVSEGALRAATAGS